MEGSMRNFEELHELAKEKGPKKLVVASADHKNVIEAVVKAKEKGWVDPVLVGNKEFIEGTGIDVSGIEIVHRETDKEAVIEAVKIVSSGNGDILLKGFVSTSTFLKAVLDKEIGLRTGRILSHIAVLQVPSYPKLLFITDGGMNIRPDLRGKIEIVRNAVEFAQRLGIEYPKVGLLGAIEAVNPDMPETMDAAEISKMNERGQIKGCVIDGPLAMDLLVSKEACEIKKVKGEVCGDVDIVVVPDIVSGNGIAKALIYLAGAKACGIVWGARKPVVMLSRADDVETKLNSIALGVVAS